MTTPIKIKLTGPYIDSLEAQEKMYRVWDATQQGFFLRVQPSGKKVFAISYRVSGVSKELTVGTYGKITVIQARKMASELIGHVSSGEDVAEASKKAKLEKRNKELQSLGNFIENHYKHHIQLKLKSHEEKLRVLNKDFGHLLKTNMLDITPAKLNSYKNKCLEKGLKPSTISSRIATLKAVLSLASNPNEGMQVIDINPLDKYSIRKDYKSDHTKPARFLSKEEEKRLREQLNIRQQAHRQERLNHIDWCEKRNSEAPPPLIYTFTDYLQPIVTLALNTGMRKGEILSLEWSEVDLKRRIVTVSGAKSKSSLTRHIPLNDEAYQVLASWREQTDSKKLVFTSSVTGEQISNLNTSWRNALKGAEIYGFRFHDLRHTFASNLAMKGISLNTVRELLGHHSIEMTLRYAHLAPEHKAEAVAVLND